jgi:hypothetical protein
VLIGGIGHWQMWRLVALIVSGVGGVNTVLCEVLIRSRTVCAYTCVCVCAFSEMTGKLSAILATAG